ncbi:pyridoxamine 5'-phosphate oxidase family protein [Halalkalicoccus sp. NIPERK01]|uniref:pyridoxamine 5'-phosphate oxidase family protein n=1 Tax=Halalkalicoccus sp. NIPERK01 TaxID=3053469 RepID=UPI00256ED3DD|nr:pyridoxamine 5'-phosphate oxidase family protein [Halalkalicoccus sp. NIPERK01]MDL5361496.1 pyridoxamine 5'-phosphate oxidase family protein [Halalkalicoccus sp. NIPERK01]
MTTESFGEITGTGMDEAEVGAFLHDRGIGVLSLARDGEAYGVPVSFGYDGTDRLYFVFLRVGEESRKEAFAAATDRASFTIYDVESKHAWRSVIVHGRIREVADDEWETVRDSIDDNAWYPSLFSEAEPMRDIQGWVLEIEEMTGQKNEG